MGRKVAVLAWKEALAPIGEPEDFDTFYRAPVETEVETEVEPEVESDADDVPDDDLGAGVAITDNVGEQSIEINVEGLIAELEAESAHGKAPDALCARRKLEDYLERKRIAQELEDFEDFLVEDQ